MQAEAQHAPHAHPPTLAHQFESHEQQSLAAAVGMWAFLV